MTARKIGLVLGPLAFALTVFTAPPAGMSEGAWLTKFKKLRHDYEHHIDEEENEVFARGDPLARISPD